MFLICLGSSLGNMFRDTFKYAILKLNAYLLFVSCSWVVILLSFLSLLKIAYIQQYKVNVSTIIKKYCPVNNVNYKCMDYCRQGSNKLF
jgi:hypothetical protein